MVIEKDRAEFQAAWEQATKQCETILLNVLIKHLKTITSKTSQKIRDTAKTTWQKIKLINPDQANITLEEALQQCEADRKKKVNNRKGKRDENQKNNAKRQKTDK